MKNSILELMEVPIEEQGLDWLKDSLQSAIELEHATLPPYLCALWSIKSGSGEAYELILSVALDEMLHMGLACNMLTTIGGSPQIDSPDFVPKYPGPLPGGVRPGLTVSLGGLTKERCEKQFMEIELPEEPIQILEAVTFPTIGAFYDAILAAFDRHRSSITGHNQLTAHVGGQDVFEIKEFADAEKAIQEIKEQGEGTSQSPFSDPEFGGELAHYYKFQEIVKGKKIIERDGKWVWDHESSVPFPETWPVADIPPGGYPEKSADFDKSYTSMLKRIHAAWNGEPSMLGSAIGDMFGLSSLAQDLMQETIPGSAETYGPSFLYVSD